MHSGATTLDFGHKGNDEDSADEDAFIPGIDAQAAVIAKMTNAAGRAGHGYEFSKSNVTQCAIKNNTGASLDTLNGKTIKAWLEYVVD